LKVSSSVQIPSVSSLLQKLQVSWRKLEFSVVFRQVIDLLTPLTTLKTTSEAQLLLRCSSRLCTLRQDIRNHSTVIGPKLSFNSLTVFLFYGSSIIRI